jgi:hypothetical protein
MAARPVRFTITFSKDFPAERVDGMLESDFMGWGKTYRGKDRNVLVLSPFPDAPYEKVKATLDELTAGGALTYVEQPS